MEETVKQLKETHPCTELAPSIGVQDTGSALCWQIRDARAVGLPTGKILIKNYLYYIKYFPDFF